MTYEPINSSLIPKWLDKRSFITSFLIKDDHGPWLASAVVAGAILWSFLMAWMFLV